MPRSSGVGRRNVPRRNNNAVDGGKSDMPADVQRTSFWSRTERGVPELEPALSTTAPKMPVTAETKNKPEVYGKDTASTSRDRRASSKVKRGSGDFINAKIDAECGWFHNIEFGRSGPSSFCLVCFKIKPTSLSLHRY